jgi:hypothetical protein
MGTVNINPASGAGGAVVSGTVTPTGATLATAIQDGSDATYDTFGSGAIMSDPIAVASATAGEAVWRLDATFRGLDPAANGATCTAFLYNDLTGTYNVSSVGVSFPSNVIGNRTNNSLMLQKPLSNALLASGNCSMRIVAGAALTLHNLGIIGQTSALPVPTSVLPANGSVVTTGQPSVSASVANVSPWSDFNYPSGLGFKREWQFATNSIFTTGVVTITESTTGVAKTGSLTPAWGLTRLAQGTWYVRCRALDEVGNPSAYSATNTFTVAHVPSTGTYSPSGLLTRPYGATVTVSWAFTDPDPTDAQSKYQAQLWKLSAPGSPIDSTLLTSGNAFHTFNIPDVTWKDTELRWKVQVSDIDAVSSGYSPEQAFYIRDPPTVVVTSPTLNQVITTSTPLITWTFTASAGRTQASYRVVITNLTSGIVVLDTGTIAGAVLQYQVPTPVVSVGPNFRVDVTLVDSTGLSTTTVQPFTASYAAPTVPAASVSSTNYPSNGYMLVDWSGATLDAGFYAWRVYRRVASTGTWALLTQITTSTIRQFKDYTAPSQVALEYAVVQANLSFSNIVESVYTPLAASSTLLNYMLVVPSLESLNFTIWSVNGDTFGDEQEMATINLLNRGRRVEYGTRFGQKGSLDISIRNQTASTARAQRLALEALRSSGRDVYLLNPFGDVWRVALDEVSITRVAGVALHEMCSATISYSEITA